MKLLLLPVSLLILATTTQAQQIQFGVKAAAGYSLPTGKYLPVSVQAVPTSGGSGGTAFYLADPYTYTLQAKPGFTAGLVARCPTAGRWSYGAEALLQYQPFAIEQRFSLGSAGGFIRDQNGNILLDANGQPRRATTTSEADLPTVYRYSMASLELPLYARYAAAKRWHLQAGVAPSLLLDKQVRSEGPALELLPNGQAHVVTTRKKQDDPALRLVNWRLVAETEYQLTSRVACTLSLRPSLSNVFSTTERQQLVVPYRVQQHAVSVAAVYLLP